MISVNTKTEKKANSKKKREKAKALDKNLKLVVTNTELMILSGAFNVNKLTWHKSRVRSICIV